MNMIVKTSDLVGFEAETENSKKAARKAALSKILAAWESKQANKAKKLGGFGFLAVSLAACNSDSGAEVEMTQAAYDAAIAAAALSDNTDVMMTTAAYNAALATATAAATTAQTAAETAKATAEAAQAAAVADKATAEAAQATAEAAKTAAEAAQATAEAASAAINTKITGAGYADVDAMITAINAAYGNNGAALTTAADSLVGGFGDDTFTSTTATDAAGDSINGGQGNDTLNMTITAAMPAMTITSVETINVDWDALGAATVDATNVTGATITVTTDKFGFVGGTTINGAGANTINIGSGMSGAVDINGVTTGTTNVTGATGAVAVDAAGTAQANETISYTDNGTNTGALTVGATVPFGTATVTSQTTGGVQVDAITATVTANSSTGTVSVADATGDNATVSATAASAVTVTTTDTATVTGGAAASTITVRSDTSTITAGGATTITVDDGAAAHSDGSTDVDITTITSTAATVSLDLGNTAALTTANVTAAAGATLNMPQGQAVTNLNFASTGAITLVPADMDDLDGDNLASTATTTTITADMSTLGAALDLADIAFTTLDVTGVSAAQDTTVASGANVTLGIANAFGAGNDLLVATGTADVLNLTVQFDQADVDTGTGGFETTNITAALDATDGDSVLTITELAMGTGTVNVSGASATTIATAGGAGTVNASGLTGAFNIGGTANTAASVTGGTSTNVVAFTGTTTNFEFAGTAGATSNTITTASTSGNVIFAAPDGTNTLTAAAVTTGTIAYTGGTGVDRIDHTNQTGNNAISANMGGGDDILDLHGGTAYDAGDTITVDFGSGTGDELMFSNATNLTAATVTLSGLERIDIDALTVTMDSSDLTGKTYEIRGDGNAAGGNMTRKLVVTMDEASADFSGLTFNNTLAQGAGGLTINGAGTVDTITDSAGLDTIDGNAGNDVITLTSDSAADTISYATGTDGVKTITGFVNGTDIFDTNFATSETLASAGTIADLASSAGNITVATDADAVFEITGTLQAAITDYTSGAQVLAAVTGGTMTVHTASDKFIMVIYDGGNAYAYEVTEGGDGGAVVAAADIVQFATFNGITAGAFTLPDIA